jgi:thiamine-phosphate pyrophosphorylase
VTLSPPVFCLVTDRRRLSRRVGCAPDSDDSLAALVAQARAAAAGGVTLVHLREGDLGAARLAELARAMRGAVAPLGVCLVVNDRVDVALAAGADGVHLKATSIDSRDARVLLGRERLIGRSVHAIAEMCTADHADYVVFGTVFPSPSKPVGWAAAGTHALADVVRAAGERPVLAIGGITVETASRAARCGAAGIAAIGAFLPSEGEPLAGSVQSRVAALRIAFDSPPSLSYDRGNG